jgi:hypothetical protein
MKKHISICLLALLLTVTLVSAQKRETKTVDTFNKVAFRTPGKLYLKQGSPQKVEIEGSAEILSKINVEVEGSRLVVDMQSKWYNWNWDNDEKIKVYVTVENIEDISVSGSGDVITETKLTTASLDLKVSGSGNLIAEIDVNGGVNADVSGSGEIELKGKCKTLESHVSGSGRVELNTSVANNAFFSVSGSGKIQASGTASAVKTNISGSGRVLAANLETNKCEVRISGSGSVEINVKEALDAHISGSGSVSYKGEPSHVNTDASGSGHVKKM